MSDIVLCSQGLTFATNAGALACRATTVLVPGGGLGATEVSRSIRRRLAWSTILESQCTSPTDTLQSTFEESTDAGIESLTHWSPPLCTRNDVHGAPCAFQNERLVFRHTFFGMVFEVLGFLKTGENRCTKSDNLQ